MSRELQAFLKRDAYGNKMTILNNLKGVAYLLKCTSVHQIPKELYEVITDITGCKFMAIHFVMILRKTEFFRLQNWSWSERKCAFFPWSRRDILWTSFPTLLKRTRLFANHFQLLCMPTSSGKISPISNNVSLFSQRVRKMIS